ncbi:hypothetical protein FRC08_002571 [Ceratobasidium sp. 394]|nr:hypothetical protein FRC08_002571 [Ceratobasidium sp. 394]
MIRNLLPIQLLRLRKKLKKEMDSGVFKLGESKPNVVEIELAPMGEERSPVEVNSFKSGVQQFREANPSTEAWSAANPCNIGCFCGAGSSRAKLGPTSVHEPPPTHSELMELFDIVEASYSALAAPEDLPTPPDDVIGDAFVLHSKIVRVSRPAGSHQDVQAKVGIANDRMNMAERQR